MGLAKGGRYRAVFFHGELTGLFCLIGVDGSREVEDDMDIFPEGGLLAGFALAVDGHAEALYLLALFVENGHDIDAAATAETQQEHLHGANAEVLAARFGAAIQANDIAYGVFGFETEISANSIQLNSCH